MDVKSEVVKIATSSGHYSSPFSSLYRPQFCILSIVPPAQISANTPIPRQMKLGSVVVKVTSNAVYKDTTQRTISEKSLALIRKSPIRISISSFINIRLYIKIWCYVLI